MSTACSRDSGKMDGSQRLWLTRLCSDLRLIYRRKYTTRSYGAIRRLNKVYFLNNHGLVSLTFNFTILSFQTSLISGQLWQFNQTKHSFNL